MATLFLYKEEKMQKIVKPPRVELDDIKDSLIKLIVNNEYYEKEYGYDFLKTHNLTLEDLNTLSIDELFMWDYIKTCEIQNLIWSNTSQRNIARLIPNEVRTAMKVLEDLNIIYAKSESCLNTHMNYSDSIKKSSNPYFDTITNHLKSLSFEELLQLIRVVNNEAIQGTETPQGLNYLSYGAVRQLRNLANQQNMDLDITEQEFDENEDEEEL